MTYHELWNVLDRNAINTSSSIWGEKMLGYLCADIICSEKRTVFRERSLRKTVSFEEKVMFNDKKPSILSKSITSRFSIGFKKQKTHIFQFSSRLSNRLRVSWKNILWEKVRERRVVDMNKIIAFRKMCTETAINETAGALKIWSQVSFRIQLERYSILLKVQLWDWSTEIYCPLGLTDRMLHVVDVRCAGNLWRSRLHLKSWFFCWIFIRALSLLTWHWVGPASK